MAEADNALMAAVALALTGERPAVEPDATGRVAATPRGIVAWLEGAGWGADRVDARRRAAQAAEQPWPGPVPRELLADAGFARYGAVLAQVRRLLGVDGLVPTVHQGPKVIGPAEQRLLAEVPPHHGSVG